MRLILIFMTFLSLTAHAQTEKPVLISGFDDVLRQAENTGLAKSAIKILEKDKTFAGMPELYQVITADETKDVKFTLVSGIATWFNGRITKFLKVAHYPQAELFLRNWLTEWSIESFKITKLEKILSENQGRHFIVVFDNSGPSLEIAETIRTQYGERISPVYLHEVIVRPAQAGTVKYVTALDIALNEMNLGRLSPVDVDVVAKAILRETNPELIIPRYAYCPVQYEPCGKASENVAAVCALVQTKISEICKSRQK